MFRSPFPRSRRLLSATTVGALGFAGVIVAAAPAQAANISLIPAQLDFSETRSLGHNDFLAGGGVRVWTEDASSQSKAAGYFAVDQDLADVGEPSMESVRNDPTTTLRPGMQLVTDFDGNGTPDGILVGEPTYDNGTTLYGDNWWLSNGSAQFVKDDAPSHGGGFGSNNNGTLDQWRAAFGDAHVVAYGWSVGSGVRADDTIVSMTLGDDTYTFRKTGAPVALPVTASGPFRGVVTVQLKGIDPDGGALKYKASRSTDGTAHVAYRSDVLTFRPRYNFGGTTVINYTVTDAEGLSATSTATITINPAPSTMTLNSRNGSGVAGRATVVGRIDSVGNPRGGVITVKEGGSTVATYTARGHSFRIPLGTGITAGPHTYDVSFAGSAAVLPSSDSETIVVR
jgi:hypothetical protein